MKITFIVLLIALFALPKKDCTGRSTFKSITKTTNDWIFDKVSGKFLKFKNGKSFNTKLFDLKYIGQIPNTDKAPFLIFSGRHCDECDANISIYIHSPSNGDLTVANGENRYGYPGTEKDLEDNTPLSKSRAFYGQVLPGINGVIWYQNDLMENKKWQKSVFLVNLNSGIRKESTSKDIVKLKLTLDLLAKGLCKEIKGVDYTSEP